MIATSKSNWTTTAISLTIAFAPVALADDVKVDDATAPDVVQDSVEDFRVKYLRDFNTERQPAVTAFPDYPRIARRDRIEGEATVCFRIDEDGDVKRPSIEDYTHKIFRRPALRAIRRSTFEALQPGQMPSKTKACRTYRFRLEPVVAETEADD
jgi:TonB family protein